jgi:hypothetical protein
MQKKDNNVVMLLVRSGLIQTWTLSNYLFYAPTGIGEKSSVSTRFFCFNLL